ncbi:MAG: hypothetical protein ABIR79_01960 [Candidatus Binatia bacterium]
MSGLGLAALAPLPVTDAYRVRLHGCRRGFGKLSQYGDRFAMVLEPSATATPIRATAVTDATSTTDGGLDALAFTLAVPQLARVAQREGYRAEALLALAHAAERAGRGLGAHLWALLENASFDVARYRRLLADLVDYASPHYLPHPVATDFGEPAIVFIPPGPEGSGRADVVPIRVQSAETRLLSFRQVWSVKPNPSQLDYGAMCALAEVHNVSLADVLGSLRDYPPLARCLDQRLAAERDAESARFRETLGLTAERYATSFPQTPRRAAFVAA